MLSFDYLLSCHYYLIIFSILYVGPYYVGLRASPLHTHPPLAKSPHAGVITSINVDPITSWKCFLVCMWNFTLSLMARSGDGFNGTSWRVAFILPPARKSTRLRPMSHAPPNFSIPRVSLQCFHYNAKIMLFLVST